MSSQPSRKIDRLVHLCVVAIVGLVGFVGGAALSFGPIAEAAVTQAAARAEVAAGARMPSIFSYQGILRNPDGTLQNGSFNMKFSIYSDIAGGTALYDEEISQVAVLDGVFSVVLGDAAGKSIPAGIFDGSPRYLGITVGADAEMVPRQRINAMPYALLAQDLAADASALGNFNVAANLTVNGALTAQQMNTSGALTAASLRLTGPGTVLTVPTSQGYKPPIRIVRIKNLKGGTWFDTGIPQEWVCGATNWRTGVIAIDEEVKQENMVWVEIRSGENGNTNHVMARLSSHLGTQENFTVDIFCFHDSLRTWETMDAP